MRFLVMDANFRQIIQYRPGLHLQIAGQLIDADLISFRHFQFLSSSFRDSSVSAFCSAEALSPVWSSDKVSSDS